MKEDKGGGLEQFTKNVELNVVRKKMWKQQKSCKEFILPSQIFNIETFRVLVYTEFST